MVNTTDFGLKQNPFRTLVTDASTKLWAGMPETKQMFEDIIVSVQPDDIGEREFVVIHGPWGAGKTHALRYFAREIEENGFGYAFVATKVRLSVKPTFWALFRSIVHENSRILPGLVKKIITAVKEEKRLARESGKYPDLSDEKFIEKIIEDSVSPTHRTLVAEFMNVEITEDQIVSRLFANANDDYTAAGMMASLIGVMTSPIGEQPAPYKAAYIFFDEIEDMLDLKPAEFFAFWSACRELVNKTAEYHCGILLAFTAPAAQLATQLPPAIFERLTRPFLEMRELTNEDAKQFISDYLVSVRLDNAAVNHPFSPFSEELIDFILNRDPEIVPRNILKTMGIIFERATRREKVSPGEEISVGIAEAILSEMHI